MYELSIRINNCTSEKKYDNFRDAMIAAEAASTVLRLLSFTRHPSCNGPIRGTNFYGNIFNEGSVMVEECE